MSTRYSKRFSRYVQPRPGLESAALALPLDIGALESIESTMAQQTASLESLSDSVLLDLHTGELSVGTESFGDWTKDKFAKIKNSISDTLDEVRLMYRKFKAKDWNDLSEADQIRIIKKSEFCFFYYNPKKLPIFEKYVTAMAAFADVKRGDEDGLNQAIDSGAKAIDAMLVAMGESKGQDVPTGNITKMLTNARLLTKKLKAWKPTEGAKGDATVIPKLLELINSKMVPAAAKAEKISEKQPGVEDAGLLILMVFPAMIYIAIWAFWIWALIKLIKYCLGTDSVGTEAMADQVLLNLQTGELSVGNEGFIDWTKDKFAKMKESVSETFDNVRLAYRQFRAKDWNDLSEADQIKTVKKAGLQFFYYNPKKLPVYEKFVTAFGEFAKTNDDGLTETIDKCVVAIDGVLVAIGESKGPEVPSGDVVKMLSNSRLLHKKLKAWQPAEGAVGDATVIPKLLAMINEKLIPVVKRAEGVSEKAAGVEARQDLTVSRVLGYILLVVVLNIIGVIIVIVAEMERDKHNSKAGNESFEDSNAVTLAADAAAVSATDLQPGVEAEGDDESNDKKTDDATTEDDTKVDESDAGDKADESEEDKSDSEDAPATDETEGGDDVTATDAGDESDVTEDAADASEETAPVEIVDEITTTTEVDLDSDYVKEIEAVNAVEAETDEVESDTEELEEISSGLESLIDAMYETQLAGGMSNLQYRTTMQHGVHNYARRAGVTVRTPGVESLGDSVRGRMYLSKVGIESAEGVASDVIEMLKNAWEQFRTMIADFFKRLFDHQSQLKEKLARIKASVGTKRTGSVKIELPSGAASSLQYDGAVGPESVKKLAADCDALTRYLKSTSQMAKMLTVDVKVDNIEDGEYTEELNSKAQESLMLPLKELKMAGVEVVETDSADGAVKVEKAETLEATEVSSVDVAAVEQAVNAYNTLIDTWKADSRYLSISDKSTKGIWNLDSMKSLAGDALKRIKAYYRLFRAYLSGLGRRIAAARKGADAAVLYLELSSKAALQLPNKATA